MKELMEMDLEELWKLFPIVLKGHNPEYMAWYEEECASLFNSLSDFSIFRINHIGSTSVKGLIAKPTVDILLELFEGYDVDLAIQTLQGSGWIAMARDYQMHTIDLNKGYTPNGFAERVYHLHVRLAGDHGELYFRDYLREHPNVSREYGQLKILLKEEFEHDRDAYTDAKSEFISKYTTLARVEFKERYDPKFCYRGSD